MDSIDVLIEVPYLWLNDGYGQTAPLVIDLISQVCEEKGLSWKVVTANIMTSYQDNALAKKIISHFIPKPQAPPSKLLIRYHYPSDSKLKADKLVTMTMFETDAIPSGWIPICNKADKVIVPTPYLQKIFSEALEVPVEVVHLPLNDVYYKILTEEELVGKLTDTFKFGFVGTPNKKTDRKGMLELEAAFDEAFKGEDAVLYLKSRGYISKHQKVITIPGTELPYDVRDFYLRTHCGVYPSRGEGYGLPQIEASLMGRPIIMALNSAAYWSSTLMPMVSLAGCEFKPARYEHASIGNPGNWGYCDINEFLHHMRNEYNLWKEDPDIYKDAILIAHNINKFRIKLSHQNIKKQIEESILPLL